MITKTKTILALIFVIALSTRCRPVMLKLYGIKDPDIENRKTILKKAQKFGLDTTNIVTVKSAEFLKTLKEADGIPNAMVFDSSGSYIEYRATDTSCNAGLFGFIPDLKRDGVYNKTGKTSLIEELKKWNDLNGMPFDKTVLKPADFYVLIYWNVWTGKLNKDHVKAWEILAKKNQQAHIEVIKVNMDFQEYWDKTQRDLIIERLTKKKAKS
jgi:hypothetical protein